MVIQLDVSLLDFVYVFFHTDVETIVVFRDHVNNSQPTHTLSELSDTEGLVFPPGSADGFGVPGGVGLDWGDVEIAAVGAVPPVEVGGAVDGAFRFEGYGVKPIGDICTGCSFDRYAELCLTIHTRLCQQLCHVEHITEEREPAVVSGVVEGHFFGGVIASDLERLGHLLSLTFGEASDG